MTKISYPEELALAAAEWQRLSAEARRLFAQATEIDQLRVDAETAAHKAYRAFVELGEKAVVQVVQ